MDSSDKSTPLPIRPTPIVSATLDDVSDLIQSPRTLSLLYTTFPLATNAPKRNHLIALSAPTVPANQKGRFAPSRLPPRKPSRPPHRRGTSSLRSTILPPRIRCSNNLDRTRTTRSLHTISDRPFQSLRYNLPCTRIFRSGRSHKSRGFLHGPNRHRQ